MKLYLYGNCQVTALHQMILEDHESWGVTSFDVSAQKLNADTIRQHFRDAGAADVLVCQPVGSYAGHAELATAMLLSSLPASTQRIILPSLFFDGTLPSFTYLPQRMPGWNMPYHDSHTIEMILRGYAREDIAALLASPDLYTAAFVDAGIAAGLTELRRREVGEQVGVCATPIIAEYGRSVSLMNTINHPNRFFLARVLNEVYRALSLPPVAAERGHDHLREPYLPPLPTVVAHLKLVGVPMDVVAAGRSTTREAYLAQCFAYYARIPQLTLLDAFREAPGYRFIKSFRGVVGVMGEPAALFGAELSNDAERMVRSVFGGLLRRRPSAEEAVAHVNAIDQMGVERWLAEISAAEEFVALHASSPSPHGEGCGEGGSNRRALPTALSPNPLPKGEGF